ncbi:hypothetical protein RCG23_18225 [Neobacillus sp. PS3-34]|uniref:hypothetical protein n=1 Tax=Neobacillus sp. PS3-34 TaxID=3070678 RepID=UPI0027E0DDAC|nr:hypothetical protein [Neobacillus sp. PS3-34]WML47379.1 hypothetical protein RCG23_18225 [Neobacillus sp. PS3-34]
MDKQDKSRTITIKLSGNEQNYQVTKQPAKPLIIRHDEENIIEESDFSQVAATEELAEDSFEWILPEITDNEIGEYKKINTEKKRIKASLSRHFLQLAARIKGS